MTLAAPAADQTKTGQQGRAEKRQRIPPRLVASSACVFMLLRNSPGHVLYTGFCRFDFSPLARLFRFADAAPPFSRIESVGAAAMKRRIGPVRGMAHETVLHRVEMRAVHMRRKVPVVAALESREQA